MELCPVFTSPASTFYIQVHSYQNHQSGNLNITGINLLQVFVSGSGGQTTAASTILGTCKLNLTLITKIIQIKAKHLVLSYTANVFTIKTMGTGNCGVPAGKI